MSTALVLPFAVDTKWTVTDGPMRGFVQKMNLAQFTIGRSTECEFILTDDPKISRKHVMIICNDNDCEIIALSENNSVLINGKEVTRGRLRAGDKLTLGDTELQLNLPTGSPALSRPSQPKRPKPKNNMRLLIYGVIALLLYLVFGTSSKKKEALKIRTEQDIQAEIDSATKLREAAENSANLKIDSTITSRQAQENYVRGFRDYRDGQYERSLVSFQACLALNPQHVLCNRYLRLAQRRHNEMIQYHIVLGRKYRDQNQYKSCRASFRNVMVMVKDANSPTYKEAKANYEACNALVEGRF